MPTVTYQGRAHEVAQGQTVLDALLKGGEAIAYGCRAGACGACVVRATSGELPPEAQVGLRDAWKERGVFYSCVCKPRGDLTVVPVDDAMRAPAHIEGRTMLSASIARLIVRISKPIDARAGQYVTLYREGIGRSFSIARLHGSQAIELHVRRVAGGTMSPYLCDEAKPGDELSVQGPLGYCVYTPGKPEQPLLLAGTGTGLSPLWGVLNDALAAGHTGPIFVFHGAVDPSGLYLVEELRSIAKANANVTYVPSVLRDPEPGIEEGALDTVVLRHVKTTAKMRAFVCGAPDVVRVLKKKIFLAGASLQDIVSDAFFPAAR